MGNVGTGVRFRLRESTGDLHRRLEDRLELAEGEIRDQTYVATLGGFLGLYRPIERELSRLDWRGAGLDFEARRKTPLIEADLSDFGFDAAALAKLPLSSRIPRADTIEDGLGILYVLEGATLGGQVISRRLAASLGLSPTFGGRFFASYGADVGRMWRSYVAVLERSGQTAEAAAAIERAAVDAFRAFDDWFADAANRAHGISLAQARRSCPDGARRASEAG